MMLSSEILAFLGACQVSRNRWAFSYYDRWYTIAQADLAALSADDLVPASALRHHHPDHAKANVFCLLSQRLCAMPTWWSPQQRFAVVSNLGLRAWNADDGDHAREQHIDAFPDEPILEVLTAETSTGVETSLWSAEAML